MGRRRNYSPKVLGYIEKHCGEGSLDWMRGELAERFGIRQGNAAVILTRVRKKMKKFLSREGFIDDK